MAHLVSLTLLALLASVYGQNVNYDAKNEMYWKNFGDNPDADKVCVNGTRQSPIDLPKTGNIKVTYAPWTLKNYDVDLSSKITNNGHTAKLSLEAGSADPIVSGGGLGNDFKFAQLHFHWGDKDSHGSEHTVGGKAYPIEVHLVHFNKKYGDDLGTAVTKGNGAYNTLAVLGVLFTVQEKDNEDLKAITDALTKIKNQGTDEKITAYSLKKLLPADTSSFYRYTGSLTTPMCNEIVVWTVFKNTIGISKEQLKLFRSLTYGRDSKALVNTYRNVLPLNGRQIFENEKAPSESSSSIITMSHLVVIGLLSITVMSK